MSNTLLLVVAVAGAYLAAHVAFDWLARRWQVVSGGEYLLLGILLGPEVSGVIGSESVRSFAPFMTLALGWIGALVGAQFHVPSMLRIPRETWRVGMLEAFLCLGASGVLLAAAIAWTLDAPLAAAVVPAVALAALAVASTPAGTALVSRERGRGEPVLRHLQVATAADAVVAISAVGLLLAVAHAAPAGTGRVPTPTEWAVINVGIGAVGGVLFHLFLGDEDDVDRLFVGLAGALILVSGAAAYLRLSALLPSMLVGAVLANSARRPAVLAELLARVERPLYFTLLVFAGAAWEPVSAAGLVLVALFLLVRTASKVGAAAGAAAVQGALPAVGRGWGLGLIGQGGLAIALALDYRHLTDAPLQGVVFTAAIVSVLLTDVASPRLTGRVLERAPRPARDRDAAPGAGGG